MCYNCGCEMPDNDMGNPKNITNKTFEEAAKASSKSPEEAKKNTLDLLEKTLGGKNKTFKLKRAASTSSA
jgi:hypothetical protein